MLAGMTDSANVLGFLRTTGDVSLDYALDYMSGQAPQFARDIAPFLRRIRE